jgi:DNA mismatch endonuclease (patch repair protein)
MAAGDRMTGKLFNDVDAALSKRMSRIRKTNSKPEILVRQIAHRLGYRFRINRRNLPGTPDIVFPRLKKIIFVHGCFWHQHPGCRHATSPRVRADYWAPKLDRNRERDRLAIAALGELGWDVFVIWECELKDRQALERQLASFLNDRMD